MFFGEERIPIVQRMILAETEPARRAALDELLPLQREDFYGVFKAMRGQPVTIRLIDPPLHEFLPKREELMVEIARAEALGRTEGLEEKRALLRRVEQLHEFNPMMGHRGVRLAISYPEIAEMQARAIIEAACRLAGEGVRVVPEIMVPLVGDVGEFRDQKAVIDRMASETMGVAGVKVKYLVGTMIELPSSRARGGRDRGGRGLLLVRHQRPDAAGVRVLPRRHRQVPQGLPGPRHPDPRSVRVDRHRRASARSCASAWSGGADARAKLKLGVCGEHSGDPASIDFFEDVGLDYVSASPFRVPTARLAAAQAALARR